MLKNTDTLLKKLFYSTVQLLSSASSDNFFYACNQSDLDALCQIWRTKKIPQHLLQQEKFMAIHTMISDPLQQAVIREHAWQRIHELTPIETIEKKRSQASETMDPSYILLQAIYSNNEFSVSFTDADILSFFYHIKKHGLNECDASNGFFHVLDDRQKNLFWTCMEIGKISSLNLSTNKIGFSDSETYKLLWQKIINLGVQALNLSNNYLGSLSGECWLITLMQLKQSQLQIIQTGLPAHFQDQLNDIIQNRHSSNSIVDEIASEISQLISKFNTPDGKYLLADLLFNYPNMNTFCVNETNSVEFNKLLDLSKQEKTKEKTQLLIWQFFYEKLQHIDQFEVYKGIPINENIIAWLYHLKLIKASHLNLAKDSLFSFAKRDPFSFYYITHAFQLIGITTLNLSKNSFSVLSLENLAVLMDGIKIAPITSLMLSECGLNDLNEDQWKLLLEKLSESNIVEINSDNNNLTTSRIEDLQRILEDNSAKNKCISENVYKL